MIYAKNSTFLRKFHIAYFWSKLLKNFILHQVLVYRKIKGKVNSNSRIGNKTSVWTYNVIIKLVHVLLYRGSPTYTKITNTVSTTSVFGLCTCKWGILLQSHWYEFHVTRFFPSPKMHIRREPSVWYFCKIFWDNIMIICWWKLSKQTSYWSKTGFFSQLKNQTIFSSQIIVISSRKKYKNIVQKDMNKFIVSF